LPRSSTKGIARHRKWLMPQEVEVWYVIPSIRRELALAMIEKGRTQKSIAKMLGVTEPAVTQYKLSKGKDSSRSRGDRVDIPEKFLPEIEKSADSILETWDEKGEDPRTFETMTREINRLIKVLRDAGILCKVHYRNMPN
jgi:hypothetical protein